MAWSTNCHLRRLARRVAIHPPPLPYSRAMVRARIRLMESISSFMTCCSSLCYGTLLSIHIISRHTIFVKSFCSPIFSVLLNLVAHPVGSAAQILLLSQKLWSWAFAQGRIPKDVRIAPTVCEALCAGTHTVDKTKSANYN